MCQERRIRLPPASGTQAIEPRQSNSPRRRTAKTVVRLTEHEYRMARRYRQEYVLLVFTAATEEILAQASPEEIPDRPNVGEWKVRMVRVYLMEK